MPATLEFISTVKCSRCGGLYWKYLSQQIVACSNCGNPRQIKPRKVRKAVTPSQRKKADLIKGYFEKLYPGKELAYQEDYDPNTAYLKIDVTTGKGKDKAGALFRITRLGKIFLLTTHHKGEDSVWAYKYANALNAHIF